MFCFEGTHFFFPSLLQEPVVCNSQNLPRLCGKWFRGFGDGDIGRRVACAGILPWFSNWEEKLFCWFDCECAGKTSWPCCLQVKAEPPWYAVAACCWRGAGASACPDQVSFAEVHVSCASPSVSLMARVVARICVVAPFPIAEGSWFVRVLRGS